MRELRARANRKDEGGFTLIEVLISITITITLIVMGAVFGLLTKGRRQNNCLVLSTLFLFQVVIAISSGITRAWQAP